MGKHGITHALKRVHEFLIILSRCRRGECVGGWTLYTLISSDGTINGSLTVIDWKGMFGTGNETMGGNTDPETRPIDMKKQNTITHDDHLLVFSFSVSSTNKTNSTSGQLQNKLSLLNIFNSERAHKNSKTSKTRKTRPNTTSRWPCLLILIFGFSMQEVIVIRPLTNEISWFDYWNRVINKIHNYNTNWQSTHWH